MKTIFLALALISSSLSFGEETIKAKVGTNYLDAQSCHQNHLSILKGYKKSIDYLFGKTLEGIQEESRHDESLVKNLTHLTTELIFKRIFVTKLIEQFQYKNLNDYYKDPSARIFDLSKFNVNIELEVDKTINEVKKEFEKKNGFVTYSKETVKGKILFYTAKNLAISSFKAMTTPFTLSSISMASMRSLSLSFGANVIKGAGVASLLLILTAPLKGARLPPEDIWLGILNEKVEFLLNPEWMKEAGSPDSPWPTHCLSMQRRTIDMNRSFDRLLSQEKSNFEKNLKSIYYYHHMDKEESNHDQRDYLILPSDNTKVKTHIPLDDFLPAWYLF